MKAAIDTFIQRWGDADGTESANFQLFMTELCTLLDLPTPDPGIQENEDNEYVFERRVRIESPSGDVRNGFIDLYRRGSFVCEGKQSGQELDTGGWDRAMMRAHHQADNYVRALPAEETRPPFILVVDVGRNIDVYAEFSRTGGTYTPFPDPRSHRIRLQDLYDEDVRERLRGIWLHPLDLDPSKHAARVTRDISDKLARLAKSLEGRGHDPQLVSGFLMRSLFTMFAEDVELLPDHAFQALLEEMKDDLRNLPHMMEHLWQNMNTGGFSPYLKKKLLHFNGGVFASVEAIELERSEHRLLLDAAKADWRYVEPAIFGTLLERALNPRERHKLGAHYTPRAYVERLVMPTIIDPLRYTWENTKAAALAFEDAGKRKEAIKALQDFQKQLTETRVLDPACGSGNFLYVAMEHMKRLEGEVLELLDQLGETQTLLEMEGSTVDPHQFLGIEINPRAAKVAEMVLWIGYLQWHFRTHGSILPPEPVLRDFKNIENRDALLEYDSKDILVDDAGKPITRWDGVTMKKSPITGEDIPDESAQVEQYVYVNPRKATWPEAEYIIGNPPFIGEKKLNESLGHNYVKTVRGVYESLPAIDFVMYWWDIAARRVLESDVKAFGLITTNSITQITNRQITKRFIDNGGVISFAFADHPWVDNADGAAVRISMTVGELPPATGQAFYITNETRSSTDNINIRFMSKQGVIHANLRVGVNINNAKPLKSNNKMTFQGVKLVGKGFLVEDTQRIAWSKTPAYSTEIVRPLVAGTDITSRRKTRYVIDFKLMNLEEAKNAHPAAYQQLLQEVKPQRDLNSMKSRREKWWIHGAPAAGMRAALRPLTTFLATSEVSKHRFFVQLESRCLADGSLVAFATEEYSLLGILSSRLHIAWALAAGGTLEDRPRYNKTVCFETFPFPVLTPEQESEIGELAEQIDAHRKRQQAQHEKLTLTNMYNVLEKLRSGEELTKRERETHEQGLVSVLGELHDALDRAVFAAYGWEHLGDVLVGRPGATTPLLDKPEDQAEAEEELLRRLVALNAERAEEEKKGVIRWLRPEYQNPDGPSTEATQEALLDEPAPIVAPKPADKLTWPSTIPEQIAAVRAALSGTSMGLDELAVQFKGRRTKKRLRDLETAAQSLEAMGLVERDERGAWG